MAKGKFTVKGVSGGKKAKKKSVKHHTRRATKKMKKA